MNNADRFWSKVVPEPMSGCWLWGAYAQQSGHGKFATGGHGKVDLAHRVVWRWEHGPIPDGHDVHHLCENPACVNTDHLQALPMVEHRKLTRKLLGPTGVAATHAAKTTCPRGHLYDGYTGKGRTCSMCRRESTREWARRKSRERGLQPHCRDRVACPRGHSYDKHNGKQRVCLTCQRERAQRRREARRAGEIS